MAARDTFVCCGVASLRKTACHFFPTVPTDLLCYTMVPLALSLSRTLLSLSPKFCATLFSYSLALVFVNCQIDFTTTDTHTIDNDDGGQSGDEFGSERNDDDKVLNTRGPDDCVRQTERL